MLANIFQKFGQPVRNLVPLLTAFFLVLAGGMVWPLPFIGEITPSFGLVAIYYWAIYRPDLFRPLAVFALGIVNDSLHLFPLGLSAFIFVGIYQLSFMQRRFFVGQIFYMLWAGFVLAALLSMSFEWIFLSVMNGKLVTFSPVLMQFLLTAAIFPLPAWILIKIQRLLLSQG